MKKNIIYKAILLTIYIAAVAAGAIVQAAPGDIDATFQTSAEATALVRSVVQPDGKILLFGRLDRFNNVPINDTQIIRLNEDGSRDFRSGRSRFQIRPAR